MTSAGLFWLINHPAAIGLNAGVCRFERRLYELSIAGRIAGGVGDDHRKGAALVLARVLRGLCRALCGG